MYYEDEETCSTTVVDLTWFAVVYAYIHALVLLVIVSIVIATQLHSSEMYGDYKKVSTGDYHTPGDGGASDSDDLEADGDTDHDDFAG